MIAAEANRRLLRETLADRYVVFESIHELEPNDPNGPFDLCIVDSITLHRLWMQLAGLRDRFQPMLLPVLALTDRRDVGLMTRDVWKVADDVLIRPLERLELAARVQSLLQLRAMSVQLGRLSGRLEHERRIAHVLQDGALPRSLPNLPGLTFHAVYRAGSGDANVGGDWYDAVRLPDGRLVVSIGDVAGSGLEAAVTMANVRQVLRGIAYVHSDPAMMLDAADRALCGSDPDRIVTAFVGVLDLVTSEFEYASAGHPWPFARRADGTVRQLVNRGTPLGLPSRFPRTTAVDRLDPGDLLVMYTDGLTEADRDAVAAEAKLARVIADPATVAASDVALALHVAMIADVVDDDVAIATLLLGGAGTMTRIARWTLDSSDRDAVRRVRETVTETIAGHGVSTDSVTVCELIFAELIGNVVRYAPGTLTIALDCNAAAPVLHVLDEGRGFRHSPKLPSDLLMESGRGLYIVATLADEFSVERRRTGGSHARVVLSPVAESPVPSGAFTFAGFDSLATST